MSDEFADIEAVMKRLPQPTLDDVLRAQREAENTPPPVTTMPQPGFHPGGIVRYHCPFGCGWSHDENPSLEPTGPLLLPANFTSGNISDAITSMAEVRGKAYARRVEQAIADHFESAHPER
ncbi:hypothetical protein [Streptomyces enissocaesilis]|uniref:Uncharacterized protein n=1 Tax=Streptomyces enissocaesilis TaxID=332589 RepID=A0ABN3WWW1_9ACTN